MNVLQTLILEITYSKLIKYSTNSTMNTEKGVRTVTVINLFLLILLILSPFICIEIYARQIMPTPILIARCLEVSSFIKFNRTECPISNHYCKWENFWKTKGKGLRAWCFSKAVLFLSSGLLPRQRRCGNCINIGYFSTRIWFAHFRGSMNWRKKKETNWNFLLRALRLND